MENAEQTNRIVVQISAQQKNIIIDAAKRAGMTVSGYVRSRTIAINLGWFDVAYRSRDGTLQVERISATSEDDARKSFGQSVVYVTEWITEQNAQSEDEADAAATIRDARPY